MPIPRRRRLTALAAAAALAVTLAIAPQAAQGAQPTAGDATKPTIVLVHGAWADGSSWAPVTTGLQIAGYNVQVAPNPLRGLHSDAAYLASYLAQATTGPVVLVGHSYGGAVISEAAVSDPDVKALVYVDAYAPDEGESVLQLTNAQPGSLLNVPDPTTVFDFIHSPGMADGEYDTFIKPELFRRIIAGNLPPVVTRQLAASQSPVSIFALGTPFAGQPAWKTIPSWFFIGTSDKVIPAAQQRVMAQRAGGKITEARTVHLSMLDAPLKVTAVIVQAAKSVK
jgi:pimeloyl-ACP methyl ester carboxylesterase